MKSVIESALIISAEIKKLISKNVLNNFDNYAYTGDNANYCISLFQENLINPFEKNKEYLYDLGQTLIKWSENNLVNGYFKMTDVHHGTELFLGFLPRYISLFPEDEKAKLLIINAADFIGNWNDKQVNWFNYKKEIFNSWYLGSSGYANDKVYSFNTADHIRFIHLAILAWEISGERKYLDWSFLYGKMFAKRILNSKKGIPVAWDENGIEFFPNDMISNKEKFLAANHHHLPNDPMSGVENLLASGAIFAFGNLYKIFKDDIFLKTSKKIISCLLNIIVEPYSDPVAASVSFYRNTFFDFSFDSQILKILENIPQHNESEIMLGIFEKNKIRLSGVGNRKDMVFWYTLNNNIPKPLNEPPTSFFTLAYQITGKAKYAERALDMASRKIKVAASVLRDGSEHADMGCAISSIISGHGRNWGIGPVSGCYPMLLIGSDENFSNTVTLIKFLTPTISLGCMPLIRVLNDQSVEINIYNFSQNKTNIVFIYNNKNEKISVSLDPKTSVRKILS